MTERRGHVLHREEEERVEMILIEIEIAMKAHRILEVVVILTATDHHRLREEEADSVPREAVLILTLIIILIDRHHLREEEFDSVAVTRRLFRAGYNRTMEDFLPPMKRKVIVITIVILLITIDIIRHREDQSNGFHYYYRRLEMVLVHHVDRQHQ